MRLSVVVPARNAAEHLDHLLPALLPQLLPDDECVLIDDASTDDTAAIAMRYGVTVVTLELRSGPAAARNAGVRQVTGDVLVFLDADVVPHAGLLDRMRHRMTQSPEVSALIGSYDRTPAAPSMVSRFRNLLHCYTHHTGKQDATTFWAGCGAMRREEFVSIGGFDALQFPEASIEDIELGARLTQDGKRIWLDPTLQVQHRKAWSLVDMLRTDLLRRAIPWTHLILKTKNMPADLNLEVRQRISGVAATGALLLLLLLPFASLPALLGIGVLLATVVTLNARFYLFLASCGGWGFALRSVPLHLLYFLCSAIGFMIAFIQFHLRSLRRDSNRR